MRNEDPVLSVLSWRHESEAIAFAKATEYGLTASILTNNVRTAFSAARAVKSGYVWINGASGHFYGTPLGGFKNSGIRPAISGSNTRALGCP
jgi:betaine-aldehyde dehydrogenase